MRLRITVRRHGLPETPIVWNVDKEAATVSQLLEQINEVVPLESGEWGLEDYAVDLKGSNGVNFECLHFQPVSKIMKEDDEVIIRPLLTQDLKIRKISGRNQISADGKHLVDGLAFGRPLLRRPADRPAVNIPPRKRRRVTYNGDEDDDEGFLALKEKEGSLSEASNNENDNRQLVLHADFEDDDSEEDEDFVPGEDEDLDDLDEATDDASSDDEEEEEGEKQEEPTSKSQKGQDESDDLEDLVFAVISDNATRAKIRKLHSAFPNSPLGVCRHVFDGSGGDVDEAYDAMALGFQPVKSKSAITEAPQASLLVPKTRSKARKRPAQEMERPDSMQVEANETAESLLDYYDRNGLPGGSIVSGNALSHMAKAVQSSLGQSTPTSKKSDSGLSGKSVKFSLDKKDSHGLTSTPHIDKESNEESEEDSDDTSEDETSSSGTSSSEEESSSEEASSSSEDGSSSEDDSDADEGSETSSSGSDSDSSSDSSSDDDAPEETSSKASHIIIQKPAAASAKIVPTKPQLPAVQAGQGTKSTKERNKRRRNANVLNRFKKKGILPAGIKSVEFQQLMENTNDKTSPEDALAALREVREANASAELRDATGKAIAKVDEFEARRQALLSSLALGGIEVGPESSLKISETSSMQVRKSYVKAKETPEISSSEERQQVENESSTAQEKHHATLTEKTSQAQPEEQAAGLPSRAVPKERAEAPTSKLEPPTPSGEPTQSSATSSRRAKLDLSAGRRLLFGALGIRTPKSKKDEEKVRSELMKDVRPLYTPKVTEESPNTSEEVAEENPDAWREKINYRAVECCHSGIELSEPPFPFVQRWDPQQQGAWSQKGNRGGKRKKDLRDQGQYYQDDQRVSKKQKQRKGKHSYAEEQEYLDASYEPSYQEDSIITECEDSTQQMRYLSDDVEGDVDQQLMNDLKDNEAAGVSQVSQGPEDLVPLPDDPTTLPDLQDGQARPGMTIAFKQLTMSEETKWQPEISNYRTAIVLASSDDGEIHLELALRDRTTSEKYYDAETGQRIYGKFDMPDQDEEEDEPADDGMLFVSFGELVQPKVLQAPPANLDLNATMDGSDKPFPRQISPSTDEAADTASTIELALSKTGPSTDESIAPSHEDKSVEAQFSHVTETPLNSDAPESNLQESNKQELIEVTNPKLDLPDDKPSTQSANNDAAEQVATPRQRDAVHTTDLNTTMEPISDEARLKIIHLMKDAGFRSSVPSSVLKEIRPDGMETPGDAAVFEKLLKDMTEIESQALYSPKFNGLGSSSPIKKLRQRTGSATREPSSSPIRVQSSWQTVDSDEAMSPPLMNDEDGSSWQTIDPTENPSSPPVRLLSKSKSKKTKPTPRKFAALGRAQELWEALQPKTHRTSTTSTEMNLNPSPGPVTGTECVNARDSNINIQYPKLSVGSSFNSQISDHGRQPDINFDGSAGLSTDTHRAPAFEDDSLMIQPDDPMSDVDQELPSHKSVNSTPEHQFDDAISDLDADAQSSDDSLPSLENVLSQRPTKQKTASRVASKAAVKGDREYERAMEALDAELSEDEEKTPKASQNYTRRSSSWKSQSGTSQSLYSQARRSPPLVSQSRTSQSQPTKFSIPKGSQVMDLTMSSDVEPEADDDDVEVEPPKKRFRKYSLEDNDDEDYEDEAGWVPKKSSSLEGVGSRRQTNVGFKASSQSSLKTARRKTTATF